MLTKQKACEAELRFASEFTRKGYSVFLPTTEDGPVDLVIHKRHSFKRVQIKATKDKKGTIKAKLRSTNNWSNKKYSISDVDLIGVYDYENKVGYLLSLVDFEGMTEVTLRVKPPKNNQKTNVRSAEKYLFFK